ncbi:ParB/RepB/Spo0J family partition protein [Convivina praedatoris]|uniref:Stage 0 sporulation protein J n=1 Tax=Convivina praedatoris TaxID=2880963 RepID=A0ABN8H7J8_9LACO|nr:ParB/RepB/Spo0J family partition protein [Convivina sp. LMG 32447]CAH1849882.1 Stage 0 sporulation protein J [Convivina sp. LMG 32447]CAH1851316.1 Stage 0 sporulation protein J [Convivina sp. LMG 32447]CAH1851330.1 Stage 0 sporulation protein J [Convivina sp. LMG 32447]
MANKKGGLGKGMDSLFGTNRISPKALAHSKQAVRNPDVQEQIVSISIDKIQANPFQPRTNFRPELIQELADSIKQNGLLTPIIVRPMGSYYQIIAGERRLRAIQLLKRTEIAAIVRTTNDETMATLALIENLQRDDLNPIEEAQAFQVILDQTGISQSELAQNLGKERTTVANSLRLLKLPKKVRDLVEVDSLSMGQARALLGLENQSSLEHVLSLILDKDLNVRQTEQLVKQVNEGPVDSKPDKQVSPYALDLAHQLEEKFGTKVKVQASRGGRGKIEINYLSQEDLTRILSLLEIEVD